MRKPNLLNIFAYLIAGISLGLIPGFFLFGLYLGRLAQVASGLDASIDSNSAIELILLFIFILVVLSPLSIYLSRFYGKAKVFLIAVVMAAILAGVTFFYE